MRRRIVEIINVGNELLDGRTLNSNLHWLSGQLSMLGYLVSRATIVRDDVEEIAEVLREAFRRRPGWIFVGGGLGPTHDDKTLNGVGRAFGLRLKLNRDALEMLKNRYEEMVRKGLISSYTITKERLKMVKLPEGSTPLRNRKGSAPGVLLERRGVRIVCLPGVPDEMKDIFENEIRPVMERESGGRAYVVERMDVRGVFESSLAPLLVEAMKRFPGVYIKSNPKGFEGNVSVVSLDFISERKYVDRLRAAKDLIRARLGEMGG